MIDDLIVVRARREHLEEIDALLAKELEAKGLFGDVDVMHYVLDFYKGEVIDTAYIEVLREGNEMFQLDPINAPKYMAPDKKAEYVRDAVAALS